MNLRDTIVGLGVLLAAAAVSVAAAVGVVGPVPVRDLGGAFAVVIQPLAGVAITTWAWRRVPRDKAESWLEKRGLTVTEPTVDMAARWMQRTRRLRAIGFTIPFVSGVAGPFLLSLVGGALADPVRSQLLRLASDWPVDAVLAPVVGYGIGALAAEVLRGRDVPGASHRVADLRARARPMYVQRFSRWAPRAVAVIALSVSAVSWAVEPAGSSGQMGTTASRLVIATVLIIGTTEVLQHWLVRRPQRLGDSDRLAVDDAARATSCHALAGTAVGATGLLTAAHLGDLALVIGGRTGQVCALTGAILGVCSYGVWLGHGVGLVHRVQRDQDTAPRSLLPGSSRS